MKKISSCRSLPCGKWLKRPLCIKGIPEELHSKLVKVLIFEVNEMFKEIANAKDNNEDYLYPNHYHIDCRDVAKDINDWYDELHLKSHIFKKVANTYKDVILNRKEDKIIR